MKNAKLTNEEIIEMIKDLEIPLKNNPYLTKLSIKQLSDEIERLKKLVKDV